MIARIQPGLVLVALFLAVTGTACALHDDLDQYPFRAAPSTLDDTGDETDSHSSDLGDSGPVDTGPDDSDMSVDSGTPDMGPDMPGDMDISDMDPVDSGPDADVPDMTADMTDPPDMSDVFGMVCPDVDPGPLDGGCNPVDQTGCPTDFACLVTVNTSTEPISFERGCVNVTPATWIKEVGEACGGSDRCVEGLHCVSGTCRQYCELATARGCNPSQYCAPITSQTAEIGACADAC